MTAPCFESEIRNFHDRACGSLYVDWDEPEDDSPVLYEHIRFMGWCTLDGDSREYDPTDEELEHVLAYLNQELLDMRVNNV